MYKPIMTLDNSRVLAKVVNQAVITIALPIPHFWDAIQRDLHVEGLYCREGASAEGYFEYDM